jgi:hypothetical protein
LGERPLVAGLGCRSFNRIGALQASQKLKADITSTQEILVQQDEDITNDNPPVIKEYLASADEDKALLEVG